MADFEAAQIGHHDVEQDEGGVLAADPFQSLASRAGGDDPIALRAQHGIEEPDVLRRVVDDQNRGRGVHDGSSVARSQCARTWPGNSLMLIGLLM